MRIIHTVTDVCQDNGSKENIYNICLAPVISTSIHHCVNNCHDIKVLMKVIETRTFNVGFTLKKSSNLDYSVFSTFFILSDLGVYLLSYTHANAEDWKTEKCI